jgi:cytochrome P450
MSKQPHRPVPYLPGEALLALYRRRGAVINSGVGRHGYTYLLGPEANKFVFANADAFSWAQTFESLAIVDGPTALIVSDGDDHRRRRSVVAPGLRHRQIQDYVQTMAGNIDAVIDGWRGLVSGWTSTGSAAPRSGAAPPRACSARAWLCTPTSSGSNSNPCWT